MKRLLQSIAVLLTVLTLTMPAVPHPGEPLMTQVVVESTAKIVLNAPSSARVGELVRLDASESTADSYRWVLVPESADFEVYAEGSKAVFSARAPGEYLFFLSIAKDGTVDSIVHRIRIIGPPDAPSDALDVAGSVRYWLWTVQGSDEEKAALADAFDAVAGMDLTEAPSWIYETKRQVTEALGDAKPRWNGFLMKIGGLMQALGEAGVMIEPDQHAEVWRQIAQIIREN